MPLAALLTAHAQQKPNIIIIYADDVGYGDIGCYGSTGINTPNLDTMAERGVRFTSAYATASTCTPSRYSLLTGEYAFRNKSPIILPGNAPLIIDPKKATLASVLQTAGYKTGLVGKWHLGLGTADEPLDWNKIMNTDIMRNAYLGTLVADALAMPVHWYYDRAALRAEYGEITGYLAPKHPHTGSILWRSQYPALNEKGEILHDQARYWGQRGVHYHQFLKPGENTLNFQLARELVRMCEQAGGYDADAWLERYIAFMLTPGSHRDTYVEEYHRGFFTRYAKGNPPQKCAIQDEHIGGLAQVAALCFVLRDAGLAELRAAVKKHVGLTHAHANVLRAADTLVRLLFRMRDGLALREAIEREAGDWISGTKVEKWTAQEDTHVIGQRFSPACYIAESMPASLYLAWKYHDDFDAGVIANAMVGGDNCHRGAVVGALLGAANGVAEKWLALSVRKVVRSEKIVSI